MKTRMNRTLVDAGAMCALLAAGCAADDQSPAGSASGTAGAGGRGEDVMPIADASAKDAGIGGLKLTWQVSGLAPLGPYVSGATRDAAEDAALSDFFTGPIEGMKVCSFDDRSIPCTTTDAAGRFSVSGLPPKSQATISFEKEGYLSVLLPIETGSADMDGSIAGPLPIPSGAISNLSTPVALDSINKGSIVAFAIAPPNGSSVVGGAIGTKLTLTPKSGDGPYFITDRNALDVSATSIVERTALFVNLDAGTYEVGFENPGYDCAPLSIPFGFGFASRPSSVKVPVVAGYETLCGVLCTPSSVIVDAG